MSYQLSKRSLDNLVGVHPDLVKVIKAAIVDSPYDFTVTEGVRTAARQQALYAQGRTKPGIIVTHRDGIRSKSNHQPKADGYGHALDAYPYFFGQVQVSHRETIVRLNVIAAHIKKTAQRLGVKITWGGDWKTPYDPPHFELSK